jgi:predicted CopG family antitoxin
MKETTTITVTRDVHKDLTIFKLDSNARNLNAVIKELIQKLKGELSPVKDRGEASNKGVKNEKRN